MPVFLHDTMSREKRPLLPKPGRDVYGMYCCGPTVYGPAHIGNFRTFTVQDVLRRTLEGEKGAVRDIVLPLALGVCDLAVVGVVMLMLSVFLETPALPGTAKVWAAAAELSAASLCMPFYSCKAATGYWPRQLSKPPSMLYTVSKPCSTRYCAAPWLERP